MCARQARLEAEVSRLSNRVGRLSDINQALKTELCDIGIVATPSRRRMSSDSDSDDEDAVSIEEIDLDASDEGEKPGKPKKPRLRLSRTAENLEDQDEIDRCDDSVRQLETNAHSAALQLSMAGKVNTMVIKGSALGRGKVGQGLIYLMALGGVLFVLLCLAFPPGGMGGPVYDEIGLGIHEPPASGDTLGGHQGSASGDHDVESGSSSGSSGGDDSPAKNYPRRLADSEVVWQHPFAARRLADSEVVGPPGSLMKNIAATLTSCGLIAFALNLVNLPLILGYLLAGVLVGPIGLGIVQTHMEIAELSSLGLIFLLFMIGLELDVNALLKMGKVVLVTGFLQFPICAGSMAALFMGLEAAGLSFGSGPFAAMYCGMTAGISSTMIVAKMLGEKGEMSSQPGRLTVGILIFQDIWAIIVLAIQPNLASPEVGGILKTFAMIGLLLGFALLYAKFIMPGLLQASSNNLELMLVLSLSWCFYIGCAAILPFVGLSMELAALIAGAALASFPYAAEFNGKIKYIRDFFITLFFAALGMQIPVPSIQAIAMGAFIAVVLLALRWVGIFAMVVGLGGGTELGAVATINLSQISEFALVICSLGMGFGHVTGETMTIIIWTFAILAISSSYLIGNNQLIYDTVARLIRKMLGRATEDAADDGAHGGHGDHRDIVLLGFHKLAYMLVAEVKAKSPQLLGRMHVVDFNEKMMPKLREVGLTCTYGDISSPDVLEHAFHGDPKICICSIPDSMLRGTTNIELVKVCNQTWPNARVIVTADSPAQAAALYKAGADYVLRMAKLCGERLHTLLSENRQQIFNNEDLTSVFQHFKKKDRELRGAMHFIDK